ncbi:N-formylglutamate amidohydrolase [Anatilimnocola floriformis]|uniref:N-formylglutamate amidohydrolase n=1 Tax=Anatilimnocola floriformis TaxID=2948575 RepID=UPI0020C48444|nr:N-formylglutamate amidohydrolase [Anatilimnocola floriformis]
MRITARFLSLLLIVAAAGVSHAQQVETFVPGQTYYGKDKHIEYLAGDLPFILSAPHGGREKPDDIPDRKEGTFAFDIGTQELARAIHAEIFKQTGHYPHVIICRITRRKIDCNREIVEACAGNKEAEVVWHDWHRFIGAAREQVLKSRGRGLYIDLHGHGHKVGQLEMGYLHSAEDYQVADKELNGAQFLAASSLQGLIALNRRPYSELIRGDFALGTLLAERGFPATPSKQRPEPTTPYFRGGYNTSRYGHDGGPIAGLQIETNSRGVRDNDVSRAKFAKGMYESLQIFFEAQFNMPLSPPAAAKSATQTSVAQPCCAVQTQCARRFRCRPRRCR